MNTEHWETLSDFGKVGYVLNLMHMGGLYNRVMDIINNIDNAMLYYKDVQDDENKVHYVRKDIDVF